METDTVVIYFLTVVISVGIIVALFFRFRYAVADLESKITGIWANEENTMRILIYSIESNFQGEVVWTRDIDEKILGSGVIRNMSLKYFSWGEGTYIDPFTKDQFRCRIKMRKPGCISFQLFGQAGNSLKKLNWCQVH